MRKGRIVIILAATGFMLGGCGERAQTATGVKSDTAHFNGTNLPYQAPGWKAGDRNAWEQQLKVRTQMGQNEYGKVN